jgi:hypothetical protein
MFPRGPACPVCGTEVTGLPAAACPSCGLPAAGQAGWVVGRIGATLDQLARDRDELLVTLRAAAPGRSWAPPPSPPPVPPRPMAPPPPVAPLPPPWPAAPELPPGPPRRRLSPQQVLLALGALLLVAGALAFVALGWTRFGLVFQAAVMVAATTAACGTSAWAARRGLRATEEALAAAGAALLAVDLGAAHARALGGLDAVPVRTWTAVSCLVVVAVAVGLNRLTRSTTTWPLVALLAAQPVLVLALPPGLLTSSGGVAAALVIAAADLATVLVLRRSLQRVARLLAAVWTAAGVLGGLLLAATGTVAESWTATALLLAAGAAAVAVLRLPRFTGGLIPAALVAASTAAVGGLALTASLTTSGAPGPVVATALGLLLLSGAALGSGPAPLAGPLPRPAVPAVRAALQAGGTALGGAGALVLADAERYGPLSLLALAAGAPALLTAMRVPRVREVSTAGALLAPAAAALLAREAGWLTSPTTGLLLALVAAGGFAAATLRAGAAEERVCTVVAGGIGVAAGLTTADVGAWGQVGLQLGVVGVAAASHAVVAHRRLVGVVAVADLVLAGWIATAGAGVETAEAYTLPAAIGLLVVAWPRLRVGGPSWAAEGAAVGVALVPSALAVVASPTSLRLVLVITGAVALVAVGTVLHRQAPFVLGAGALAFVVVTRLGRYAPLVPTWVTLAIAGLLLLVLGATYERRLHQAREAVAWVAQMG